MGLCDVAGFSPFPEGRFRWRMGTRALDASRWLQIDDRRGADLSEKARLWRTRRDEVFAARPGSVAAAREIWELVEDTLLAHGLQPSSPVGDGAASHPLAVAGLAVQEDLCLLERRRGRWVLTAGSVSFPTRWELRSKIGRSLDDIHGPVPAYRRDLATPVTRSFDRMAPGRLVERLNWSVVGDGSRRLDSRHRQAPLAMPADPASMLHLRIERQTLRRLVDHEAVVFGIRIHVWPLAEVVDPSLAERLATALETMPPEVAVYKDLDGLGPPLVDWLRRRAAEMPG